jgi:ADP-L-glycero-D-manno-heptose 6-epimerase
MGENGFDDNTNPEKLIPLNPYGVSKNEFDKWVLKQSKTPYFWAGLKFFNVYGPNEYHKGRMASVVFHAFNQIKSSGKLNLFRSHKPEFSDGGQLRDFIYVKDVTDVLLFLMLNRNNSGIFNLGTGKARSFKDLGIAVFKAMDKPVFINYIDTPFDIRDKYQYYTQAEMSKLESIGYKCSFESLEDGIRDYVNNYLILDKYE